MFVPVGAPPRRRPLRQGLCKVAALLSLALAALSFLSGAESPQALISVACADNSGAWELKILACKKKGRTVRNYKLHEVAPGDMVVVIGRTSGPKNRIMRAVVTRMRKWQRDTAQTSFYYTHDQAAAVLIDAKGNPVGSKIRGPIDPACARRWPKIAALEQRK
mmetsp:Transcript_11305/g.30090  ORF Transcript_11305/g.30090 Transcript_11305/m.30090 type:complete len:163 (-) Transcript_11305:79-567(-)